MNINTDKKIYYSVCCTLAFLLSVIMIYREIPAGRRDRQEAEAVREKLMPAAVTSVITETVTDVSDAKDDSVSHSPSAPEAAAQSAIYDNTHTPDGLVNLNTADEKTLMTLKGIGVKKAEGIIQYRKENGAFTSVDDLASVPGIGRKTADAVRDFVTVSVN